MSDAELPFQEDRSQLSVIEKCKLCHSEFLIPFLHRPLPVSWELPQHRFSLSMFPRTQILNMPSPALRLIDWWPDDIPEILIFRPVRSRLDIVSQDNVCKNQFQICCSKEPAGTVGFRYDGVCVRERGVVDVILMVRSGRYLKGQSYQAWRS